MVKHTLSVIRKKGESQSWCFKKAKHAKFLKNKHFLLPDTHMYICISGGQKCLFFGILACFAFLKLLKHPFSDSPFCLIPDDFENFAANAARF